MRANLLNTMLLTAGLVLAGCGDKDDDTASSAFSFSGGNFQFASSEVQDLCFDGDCTYLALPITDDRRRRAGRSRRALSPQTTEPVSLHTLFVLTDVLDTNV